MPSKVLKHKLFFFLLCSLSLNLSWYFFICHLMSWFFKHGKIIMGKCRPSHCQQRWQQQELYIVPELETGQSSQASPLPTDHCLFKSIETFMHGHGRYLDVGWPGKTIGEHAPWGGRPQKLPMWGGQCCRVPGVSANSSQGSRVSAGGMTMCELRLQCPIGFHLQNTKSKIKLLKI